MCITILLYNSFVAHAKQYVSGEKKHIAVSAILLTILTINMADIT